jgi:2-dehydro-3-deoxyphosphooctonate aldolase (KDO 8-P synthase)
MMRVGEHLAGVCRRLGVGYCFKSSFTKDNRTSVDSYRGPGLEEGLRVLERIGDACGVPVLTDIHHPEEAPAVAQVAEILQIPAFLCRQTSLLEAAGRTGRIINIKKGQFLAPWDMQNVADKVASTGNDRILLTDRGTSFGYNMLVSDMRSLPIMAQTGYPVVFDATHSVQLPGGLGGSSGGQREFVPPLARGALAVGCASVFIETHETPETSPSDGPNMVPLGEMAALLSRLKRIDQVAKEG